MDHSVYDDGAVGDGVADDLAAFSTFGTTSDGLKVVPDGAFRLSSAWAAPVSDVTIRSGDVSFPGSKPDLKALTPFQGGPVWSQHVIHKSYTAPDWMGFGNIFNLASYANSGVPASSSGGANVVAVFGGADGSGDGSSVWGGNFVAYANNATATAIGTEINFGALVAGGLAYGIVLASAGSQPTQSGIQLQSNNASSLMKRGIYFNNRSTGLATEALIKAAGSIAVEPAPIGIDFSVHTFSVAELLFKSFRVAATVLNTVNRLFVSGAAAGNAPQIAAEGTDANIDLLLSPKGTGKVRFGTYSSGGATPAGYITIKDASGVTRKLAVLA